MCAGTLLAGALLKGQCLDGRFNDNAFRRLCYNDLQPLFGPRLHTSQADGTIEKVFPYIHGSFDPEADESLQRGAIEYPVLTGLFMYLTGLPVDDADSYLRLSMVALAPFALIAAYLLGRWVGWRALLWSLAPALVLYSFHNWDLLVVATAVGGLWAWRRGPPVLAGALLGVGASFKMWPILFLAPLFLDTLRRSGWQRAMFPPLAGVGVFLAINLPFAFVNFDGWFATYAFHAQRGPNFDSIWWVGFPGWDATRVSAVSTGLTIVSFALALGVSWFRRPREAYPFLQTCGALLAIFLLWNKVHSPQFTLWLLPFFVLLNVRIVWWVAYAIADLAVYVGVFRWFYEWGQGIQEGPALRLMEGGVWARAALLAIVSVVFLLSRTRPEVDDNDPTGEARDTSPEVSEPQPA